LEPLSDPSDWSDLSDNQATKFPRLHKKEKNGKKPRCLQEP
jgi:hypothetical protein